MKYLTYNEQLLTNEWQVKRKEALEFDKHTCQICFHKDKPLEVHHKRYISGKMAWEYNVRDLITLCHNCHSIYHRQLLILEKCYKLIRSL